MKIYSPTRSKVGVSVLCGLMVTLIAAGIHAALLPHDRNTTLFALMGDLIAGLVTMVVCLAIQLKQEEVHFRAAMERAAIVAELNHHVRNAIFPLCLAVQKVDDVHGQKICDDATNRINLALREAVTDVFSQKVTSAGVPKKKPTAA